MARAWVGLKKSGRRVAACRLSLNVSNGARVRRKKHAKSSCSCENSGQHLTIGQQAEGQVRAGEEALIVLDNHAKPVRCTPRDGVLQERSGHVFIAGLGLLRRGRHASCCSASAVSAFRGYRRCQEALAWATQTTEE